MDVADRIALQVKLKVDDMMRFLLPNTTEGVEEALKLILSNPPRLPESPHKELLEMVHLKNRDAKVEVYCESTLWTDKAHFSPTLTQILVYEFMRQGNLHAHLFKFQIKQIVSDGLVAAKALVTGGVDSFALASAGPQRLEATTRRKFPYGD